MALRGLRSRLSITAVTLTPELKRKAQEELFEDDDNKSMGLVLLKDSLLENNILPFFTRDDFLLQMLRARKYDIPRTLKLCRSHLAYMKAVFDPDYIGSRGEISQILHMMALKFDSENVTALPQRDDDDCIVIIYDISKWVCRDKFSFKDSLVATIVIILLSNMYPASHIAGFKIISDFRKITSQQFRQMGKLDSLRMMRAYVTVIVHKSDPEKLTKYISPNILPCTLGGTNSAYNETYWSSLLRKSESYLQEYIENTLKIP